MKNRNFKKNLKLLTSYSNSRSKELFEIETHAIANYGGQAKELESAIGLLRLGDHLGWRPLLMIHNKATIRKYEEILGIKVRELFEEEGPSAQRSIGYFTVSKAKTFWKAVRGDVKVEQKGEIQE